MYVVHSKQTQRILSEDHYQVLGIVDNYILEKRKPGVHVIRVKQYYRHPKELNITELHI